MMTKPLDHLSDKFQVAVEYAADNIMITDKDGLILYVNPAFVRNTGFSSLDAIGKTPKILNSGRNDRDYYRRLWHTISAGQVFRATVINCKKSGELYYADQTISPIKDESGAITYFISIWKDITERIQYEDELNELNKHLKNEKEKLEQVLSIEEGLHSITNQDKLMDFIVKKTCDVLEAERCSLMFLDKQSGELCIKAHKGLSEDLMIEKRVKLGENVAGWVAQHRKPVLVEDIEIDYRFQRPNGELYKTKSFISAPIEINGHLLGVINVSDKKIKEKPVFSNLDLKILCMIVRQVAVAMEAARSYRELKHLTILDPITNIYNHRYLAESLEVEIKRYKRYGRSLSLLMIDIDGFKSYNDTYGHVEGDRLLQKVANTFLKIVREVDVLCRYAGDEFAIILPETDISEVEAIAEKLRAAIDSLEFKRKVTISIGAAHFKKNMTRYDLVHKADTALYEAKKLGKNKVVISR